MQGSSDEMKMNADDLFKDLPKVKNSLESAGIDIDAIMGRYEK